MKDHLVEVLILFHEGWTVKVTFSYQVTWLRKLKVVRFVYVLVLGLYHIEIYLFVMLRRTRKIKYSWMWDLIFSDHWNMVTVFVISLRFSYQRVFMCTTKAFLTHPILALYKLTHHTIIDCTSKEGFTLLIWVNKKVVIHHPAPK